MENNRIKCTVDTEKVKLVNKDNFDIVNYIESDIKLQPPDCSLFSEEGFEIPIHKEVLYQTKFMREMLKSMDCCCCKVELFFPTLAKEDLEVMVNFLYNGKIICRNRSDLCRVVVNLTQFLGFPNYMDLRSITNCYALQERTFEKGGNNKIKGVKKEQKFAASNGNIEHPPKMKCLREVKNLKILIHSPNEISRHEMEVDQKIKTVESKLDDEKDLSKNIDLSEGSSQRVSNPFNSAIEQGQGLNSSDNLEASDIISLAHNQIRQTSNLNAIDVKAYEVNKNNFDPDMSSVEIKPVTTLKMLYECHRKRFPNVKISNSNIKFKNTAAICLQELLQLKKQDILDNKKFWNKINNFWSRLPKMYRKYPDSKNMFHRNKNFFEHEFNILPSDNSNPNQSNQDTIVEENEADPEVSDNEFDLGMSCDEIRPHTSYKSTITSMDNQIRQTSNLVAFRTEKDTKNEHTNLLNIEDLSKKCLDGILGTKKISDKPEMMDLISEKPNHEIAGQEIETIDDKITGESGDSDDYDSDNSDSSIFELSESSPRRSTGDKHMLKQEVSVSPNDIDASKNTSTDDEISDASIIEEIDDSMNLKTKCFDFLNRYESSFNDMPNSESIETSNFESEKIPANPTFLHCNICKNKHTRFLAQTELDEHMDTFHVQKTVNGFKVVSVSKNNMKGTKEIVFEKHETEHQMKDIQKKTEVEVEIGTLRSEKKKLVLHLKCSECDKTFSKNYLLEHHMNVIHKKTREEIYRSYQSEKKSPLENVISVQEGKKLVYSCHVCGKTFKTNQIVNTHVAAVHEKKMFKCSACEKSFKSTQYLQVHFESVHEGKKRFECNLCGKKYAAQQKLEHHIASIHEGIKPHLCSFCGHATFQSNNLKKHIAMVHEGQRPFSCDVCEKTFKRNQHLMNHKALVHDGKKTIKCPTCDKTFVLKKDMQKHAFIHTNKRPHECNACDAKFKRGHHLRAHLRTIHGLVK